MGVDWYCDCVFSQSLETQPIDLIAVKLNPRQTGVDPVGF
jgi:hypothetical protein